MWLRHSHKCIYEWPVSSSFYYSYVIVKCGIFIGRFIKLTVRIYESITLIYLLTIICWITTSLQADVYDDGSGACAAFLANMDDKTDKNAVFRNVSYHLPAWSVSILPDCKNVVFNTAKVNFHFFHVYMLMSEYFIHCQGWLWGVLLKTLMSTVFSSKKKFWFWPSKSYNMALPLLNFLIDIITL